MAGRPETTRDPRFLADAMLIRLGRWLRVLNFDTRCHPEKTDAELVALADAEDRWLLTRDRALVDELKPIKPLLIANARPLDQLIEVIEHCRPLPPSALFKRCLLCNTTLKPVTRAQAKALAPGKNLQFTDNFNYCPGCGRLYWPGSHTRRMKEALHRTVPVWLEDTARTGPYNTEHPDGSGL